MGGRWLVNLLLAVVVGVLGWGVLDEVDRTERASRLTALQETAVERVELRRDGEAAIVLVRDGDGWQMREPVAAAADAVAVARLLPIVAAESERALPAAAVDLKQLGLATPEIRLALNGLELRFGALDPVNGQRYVQVGDLVHLIEDRFVAQLVAAPEGYLSRRLLPAGFSPGLGSLDGQPLSADDLAALAGVEAERVEPLGGELTGRLLRIESADGGEALRFLVADGGRRWSRLDQRLSYVLGAPPLPGLEGAAAADDPFAPVPAGSEPFDQVAEPVSGSDTGTDGSDPFATDPPQDIPTETLSPPMEPAPAPPFGETPAR